MWRSKVKDLEEIVEFIENLSTFKGLKEMRWERIEEEIQKGNRLASPQEDWIIPPDENEILKELEKDPDYCVLRERILRGCNKLKHIGTFLHCNMHHDFDWIIFTSPLIGNDALEDALSMAYQLEKACGKKNYFIGNLAQLFKK